MLKQLVLHAAGSLATTILFPTVLDPSKTKLAGYGPGNALLEFPKDASMSSVPFARFAQEARTRRSPWPAIAVLLVGAGCPSEFRAGGRIDQAVEKDLKDLSEEADCPAGMHQEDLPCSNPPCRTNCVADASDGGH